MARAAQPGGNGKGAAQFRRLRYVISRSLSELTPRPLPALQVAVSQSKNRNRRRTLRVHPPQGAPEMRASHIILSSALLMTPSASYSQDSGLVSGRVGSDLSASPTQPSPSIGSRGPYGRPPEPGPRAGYSGSIMPGQVVPQRMPVVPQPGGQGAAFVDGHRVLVDPNSNRILRVFD